MTDALLLAAGAFAGSGGALFLLYLLARRWENRS